MAYEHFDFKSVDPKVYDADTIEQYVGYALYYQHFFERRTTPWEKDLWDYDQLHTFTIELEEVDRLYYIYHSEHAGGQEFKLAVRVEHKGKPLYVEMNASCDYTGFNCQGDGIIFVSTDANLFMKLILTEEYDAERIYESLEEDGIYVEPYEQRNRNNTPFRNSNAPMLKYLCHQAIYDNKEVLLEPSRHNLPKLLRDSVQDFIRTKEAIRSYDGWDDDGYSDDSHDDGWNDDGYGDDGHDDGWDDDGYGDDGYDDGCDDY